MKMGWFPAVLSAALLSLAPITAASATSAGDALKATSAAVVPAMEKNQIPGMAVGLVLDDQTYIFNFGVADMAAQRPVTNATRFEIGSLSKTFTAALPSYAEATGKLRLSDPAEKYLPQLEGSAFGKLQLMQLGTHTTGGMPLQVPDELRNEAQLLKFLRTWTPADKPGAVRSYSNVSIGALGWITATRLGQDFKAAMHAQLLQPLGLNSTHFTVPAGETTNYAWGYTKDNRPVRVNPGLLDSEAYGIKTTAADLTTFLKANMGMLPLDGPLEAALRNTRVGYFTIGKMTQGLIWEAYPLPVELPALYEGNSSALILNPKPAAAQVPPGAPRSDVWVNKTGSTGGFGAYAAFVPAKRFGIVVLANKNYPISDRVEIAYRIYSSLYE